MDKPSPDEIRLEKLRTQTDSHEIRLEKLRSQTEREMLLNMMMKGELVLWRDIVSVFGTKLIAARNRILAIPAQFADRLPRDVIEEFRKMVHDALTEACKVGLDDVLERNKKLTPLAKAARQAGNGQSS